jgi:hypothetical protein
LICLFSTHDKTCIDDLYKECSHLLDQEEFVAVFENATDDFHSFLAVDLSQTDPNLVFSKEFEHWYQIRNSPSGEFPAPEQTEGKDAKSVGVGKLRKPRSKKSKLDPKPEPKIKSGALI